jgi:hypothetical protein
MTLTARQHLGLLLTAGVTVLAAGCSGSGSSAPVAGGAPATGRSVGSTKAKLSVGIPIRQPGAKSQRRKPQYVSSATAELAIRTGTSGVGGTISTASYQLFDVSANAPACTTTATVRTCVISVTAPLVPGSEDEIQVIATDKAPLPADTLPSGDWLSTGDTSQVITAGADNPIPMLLVGVIGSLATDFPAYSVWAAPGQTANVTVNITADDYGGGAIAGSQPTFNNPIVFNDGLTSSPFTYPSANLSANNYGLPPPLNPGPIPATINYAAPLTTPASNATVTLKTDVPSWLLPLPDGAPGIPGPVATFALDPLTVSLASAPGVPIAAITGLSATGPDVTVTVSETGAATFTVASSASTFTLFSASGVALPGPITATNGVASFIVHPVSPTSASGTMRVTDGHRTNAVAGASGTNAVTGASGTIAVTDATGTTATLSATVGP